MADSHTPSEAKRAKPDKEEVQKCPGPGLLGLASLFHPWFILKCACKARLPCGRALVRPVLQRLFDCYPVCGLATQSFHLSQ